MVRHVVLKQNWSGSQTYPKNLDMQKKKKLKKKSLSTGVEGQSISLNSFSLFISALPLQFLICSQKLWGQLHFTILFVKSRKTFAAIKNRGSCPPPPPLCYVPVVSLKHCFCCPLKYLINFSGVKPNKIT